jgi:glycosyltransferase involved in cell wall biosynthesis
MNVGLVIYGSLDTQSGGYLYDRMLVAALRQAGNHVKIFSLPRRSYPIHLTHNLWLAWADHLAAAKLDLLLQDELNHPSLFLLNHCLRSRIACPFVAIVHHLRSQEEHPASLQSIYRTVERSYLRTLDGFLFNSHTTRASVQHLLGASPPGYVAYPAADHCNPPARPVVLAALAQRARRQGPLRVLFVGNVIRRKGLHLLTAALSQLPVESWRLEIVGSATVDPSYVEMVHSFAAQHNLTHRITWHGSASDAALQTLLATCDLLAVPSYEGFGIVYLEAMAYGLPVIATTAGAAHELVEPGVNGYLVSPGDSAALAARLRSLTHNRSLLAVMGYQARLRYERHPSWSDSMSRAIVWLHEVQSCFRSK